MYTKHATERMQQRGLTPYLIELVLDYGDCRPDHRGAEIYYLSKKSKKRLRESLTKEQWIKLDHGLDAFVVMREGHVVTCGHRFHRVWRH